MYDMPEVDLSGCNCCAGISAQTPVQIYNLPGLPAIAYRVGNYTQFRNTMQTRLADAGLPGLNALKTRQGDDFTIALLDSWAVACDVLTFYQERSANESYKRTATERASLLELARLVRYNLQPGVASNTYLAFTLDDTPGSPGQSIINIGTKAQSLPNPGEVPQVFETVDYLVARAKWNAMQPVTIQPQQVFPSSLDIWLAGTNANLKPGDVVLIVDTSANHQALHHVQAALIDRVAQQTHVLFDGYKPPQIVQKPLTLTLTDAYRKRMPLTDDLVRQLIARGASQHDLESIAVFQGWSTRDLFASIAAQSASGSFSQTRVAGEQALANPQVFVLRLRASLFGQNAADWNLMPKSPIQDNYIALYNASEHHNPTDTTDWPYIPPTNLQQLDLDRVYPQIIPGSWIAYEHPGATPPLQFAQVVQVQQVTDTNYALSLKVTRLALGSNINQPQTLRELRQITVYAQSEALALAELPVTTPVSGDTITVNGVFDGLGAGRLLVVTGQLSDQANVTTSEFVTLASAEAILGNRTILHLKNGGLFNNYEPATVSINANVVAATQGESVQNEILGSGDATQTFQSFTLRKSPLTYVQASTPTGRASTLRVFVNGIAWNEVDAFYGHGPQEHIFVTHIGDDGTVIIQFGDGRTGARLPGGEDNVTASYRTGTGTQGLVQPGQIKLLKTRPLGVKGVSNPLAPTGAIDPDTLDDARRNADNTVITLGRIVSGSDYEEFALSYAAVAKASATIIWNNLLRAVVVTIAGPATPDNPVGVEIVQGSGVYNKIYAGMRAASDPTIPFSLQSYTTPFFRISALVKIQADYATESVLAGVQQTVLDNFSFAARNFSQDVTLQEVIAATQAVPGVVTVRFYQFYRVDNPPTMPPNQDNRLDETTYLSAALPTLQADGTISLAELLIIDPNQPFDALEEMP